MIRRALRCGLPGLLLAALLQAGTPLLAAAYQQPEAAGARTTGALPAWTVHALCAPAGWNPPRAAAPDPGRSTAPDPRAPWCPLCLLPPLHPALATLPDLLPPVVTDPAPALEGPRWPAGPAQAHLRLSPPRAPPRPAEPMTTAGRALPPRTAR